MAQACSFLFSNHFYSELPLLFALICSVDSQENNYNCIIATMQMPYFKAKNSPNSIRYFGVHRSFLKEHLVVRLNMPIKESF